MDESDKIDTSNEERFNLDEAALQRFRNKYIILPVTGCWEWHGSLIHNKYGRFSIRGRTFRAHRVAYEHYTQTKCDYVLDHYLYPDNCIGPRCVNPSHLKPTSHKDNVYRSNITIATINRQKTHCPQGHEYDMKLKVDKPGGDYRSCSICRKEARQRYEARRRQWRGRWHS